ncbi:hypothetical protein AB1L88_15570 [Tautonia sp. JC769]|uniref:hypothetical protein n=1 Tax=Tautonia sp. JC769 TaxID=3232135 RepID=UPI00345ABABB
MRSILTALVAGLALAGPVRGQAIEGPDSIEGGRLARLSIAWPDDAPGSAAWIVFPIGEGDLEAFEDGSRAVFTGPPRREPYSVLVATSGPDGKPAWLTKLITVRAPDPGPEPGPAPPPIPGPDPEPEPEPGPTPQDPMAAAVQLAMGEVDPDHRPALARVVAHEARVVQSWQASRAITAGEAEGILATRVMQLYEHGRLYPRVVEDLAATITAGLPGETEQARIARLIALMEGYYRG